MAIQIRYRRNFNGVNVKSGWIYSFDYLNYQNDPKPTVIIMYAFQGTHPNTGHRWTFFQAINLSYIPRSQRKQFAKDWIEKFSETNGNVKFTWKLIQRRYPYLQSAVRRYFYQPSHYIRNLREYELSEMNEAIVSTWSKDFSKRGMRALIKAKKKLNGTRKAKIRMFRKRI